MKLHKIVALTLMLYSSSAFAADAPVAALPTPPSPPQIVATSPNETAAGQMANTNKVYIDQAGSNVNINIQQIGVTNVIGTATDPIYLRGDNQTIIAIQTGNLNNILMSLVSDAGQTGIANVTLRQIGNSNNAVIRCGNGANESSCNKLDMNAKFTGNYNNFTFHGAASNIRNSMDFTGNYNVVNIEVTSPNASQTLAVNGDYNNFNLTQTGVGGTYGHSFYANFTGSGNSVTSQQYGPTETIVNINSVGSNGTFNIKTGH